MKLLYCMSCHDVQNLVMSAWRKCQCGNCGGQYNEDGITAMIGGTTGKVFGIANPFFNPRFPSFPVPRTIDWPAAWTPEQLEEVHLQGVVHEHTTLAFLQARVELLK